MQFVTSIPMKSASEYQMAIIYFDYTWEIVGFIEQVFVGLLALLAVYNFEILAPKAGKLAAKDPSPEMQGLKKKQMMLGAISFLFGIIIIALSLVMRYL
jgi:hypothetical protein